MHEKSVDILQSQEVICLLTNEEMKEIGLTLGQRKYFQMGVELLKKSLTVGGDLSPASNSGYLGFSDHSQMNPQYHYVSSSRYNDSSLSFPERSVDDTVNNNDTVDIPACSDEANTVIDGTDNSDDNQNMSISDHVASEGYVSGTNEVEAESESGSLEEEKFANEKNNSKDC